MSIWYLQDILLNKWVVENQGVLPMEQKMYFWSLVYIVNNNIETFGTKLLYLNGCVG